MACPQCGCENALVQQVQTGSIGTSCMTVKIVVIFGQYKKSEPCRTSVSVSRG